MLRELRRILSDSVVYGLGGVLPKIVGVLLIPVYTRYLSPSDYGVMSLAALLAVLFGQLVLLGTAGSVTRFYRTDDTQDEAGAGSYLFTVVLFDLLFAAVVTGAVLLVGPSVTESLSATVPFRPYLAVAFLGAFLGIPLTLLQSALRARGKAARYTMMSLASFLLNTAFTLYFVVLGREGALGSLKGTAVSAGLLAPYLLWELSRLWRVRFSGPALSKALWFGIPLVPHAFAGWLVGYADRYVLGRFRSTTEVGLYSLAYSVGLGMSIVATAVNQAWTPAFYDIAETVDGPARLRRLTTIYGAVVTLLGCAFVLFSRELTQVLASPAYREAAVLTPIVVCGYYLQAIYFVTVTPIFFMKKTNLLFAITGPAAVVNLAANFLLIPRWGMYAAAWVTVATFAVLAGGAWVVSSHVRPNSFEHRRLISLIALFVVVYLAEGTVAMVSLSLPLLILSKFTVLAAAGAAMFLLRIVSRDEIARTLELVAGRVGHKVVVQQDPEETV